MSLFHSAYTYTLENLDRFTTAFQQHLGLVFLPLAVGLLVGLPLGLWSARSQVVSAVMINSFNALRVIPSLAVLFLAIPYFGLSFWSAVLALTLLVMPPILISTDVAFRTIDPAIREAATGMGMPPADILRRVEIPLALPVVIAGIKTAAVEVIASATLAAFVGAGGLGTFVVLGFAVYDPAILLIGAVPVALLALIAEVSLSALQRAVQPPTA
ncbi:ABC transporter permease [Pseudanabaena sp. FACHB-2040]|uniref:ABC transporter permease n=1 Tax=Pseudanabaena sp. FACHB-2040 TaxID=2692859 RepID=UPI0016838A6C|nr:ABC transporter permease [Pseudanabaena sp. FACHB-2040]MBD0269310.1 ABC transporter permease [Cyanobacteria bacterium Co-bin8]MBD2259811.1 ABC transporter permease [Pseudanabaena sp. FACHB-2040]